MRTNEELLRAASEIAREYYQVTGRPLGITGEIAEYEAASKLGLILAEARAAGYDATKPNGDRVQIKGRLIGKHQRSARIGSINLAHDFECVVLVLLDDDFSPREMLEAPRTKVEERLRAPGSKARNERGSLGVSQFRSIATRVWPVDPLI